MPWPCQLARRPQADRLQIGRRGDILRDQLGQDGLFVQLSLDRIICPDNPPAPRSSVRRACPNQPSCPAENFRIALATHLKGGPSMSLTYHNFISMVRGRPQGYPTGTPPDFSVFGVIALACPVPITGWPPPPSGWRRAGQLARRRGGQPPAPDETVRDWWPRQLQAESLMRRVGYKFVQTEWWFNEPMMHHDTMAGNRGGTALDASRTSREVLGSSGASTCPETPWVRCIHRASRLGARIECSAFRGLECPLLRHLPPRKSTLDPAAAGFFSNSRVSCGTGCLPATSPREPKSFSGGLYFSGPADADLANFS